jgi:hypothetical protein
VVASVVTPETWSAVLRSIADDADLLERLHRGSRVPATAFGSLTPASSRPGMSPALRSLSTLGVLVRHGPRTFGLADVLQVLPSLSVRRILRGLDDFVFADAPSLPDVQRANRLIAHEALRTEARQGRLAVELSRIVRAVMHDVPLNSLAAVRYAAGEAVDLRCGGNCVLHARVLQERVEASCRDVDVRIVRSDDGLHFAVIVDSGSERYLLDTTAVLPARALRLPEPGEAADFAPAAHLVDHGQRAFVAAERIDARHAQVTGFWPREDGMFSRRHRFDLSRDELRADTYLRDPGYVLRVAAADGVLVYRVITPRGRLLTWFYSLTDRRGHFLDSGTGVRRISNEIGGEDRRFRQFLEATGMGRPAFELYARESIRLLDRLAGEAGAVSRASRRHGSTNPWSYPMDDRSPHSERRTLGAEGEQE